MSRPSIDRILVGRVLTLNPAGDIAQAVALQNDRIVAVGDRDDVLDLANPGTKVLRTDGTIIPGFNDTHAHMDTEGLRERFPSLGTVRSIADVQARIAELAHNTPRGEWIVTMPVGDAPFYFGGPIVLAERRMPTREELDLAAPDHPVCILPPSGYWSLVPCYTALNSLGLKLNGLDRTSTSPVEGVALERDAAGELTGVIVEHNYPDSAQIALLPAVPRFSPHDRREGIKRSIRAYHSFGTTSVYEGHGCAPDVIAAYRDLREADELTMRMHLVVSPFWNSLDEAERDFQDKLAHARGAGLGDDMLRVGGVFIGYGGEQSAALASMARPGDLGWSCYIKQANTPEQFERLCLAAARSDLRVHTIAVDKLHEIVAIYERVNAKHPIAHRRWVIEHMSHAAASDLARLKDLGIGVTLIPDYHLWKVGTRFFPLDEADRELVAPASQLDALGVPVGCGTDNSPCNPLAIMRAMRTRRERTTGQTIGPRASASAELALRAMTRNGAWFSFEEARKGQIAPGYLADLTVLSGCPLTTSAEDLESLACNATLVGGRVVHGDI
ncbi:amidohydrolase [Bradyrhizobium sp.]|uniref:amidohydrolase n=1 Tax=Bradyrhizobium sp. TaxID=376 RepID=UPI0039E2CA66